MVVRTSTLQDDLADYFLEIRGKISQQPIGSITVDYRTGEWLAWPKGRHPYRRCKRIGEAISWLIAEHRANGA